MCVILIGFQVVLDLLQIPFDAKEDVRMNELMRLAHLNDIAVSGRSCRDGWCHNSA